jgi:hypothetical protein
MSLSPAVNLQPASLSPVVSLPPVSVILLAFTAGINDVGDKFTAVTTAFTAYA